MASEQEKSGKTKQALGGALMGLGLGLFAIGTGGVGPAAAALAGTLLFGKGAIEENDANPK